MHTAPATAQPAKALEAASAFARLYRRWFDDARGLFEDNKRQARLIAGSPVVDVLAVWDEGLAVGLPTPQRSSGSKSSMPPSSP